MGLLIMRSVAKLFNNDHTVNLNEKSAVITAVKGELYMLKTWNGMAFEL